MNRTYTIMTEVTCDLPLEYVNEHNIKLMPLTYTLDGIEYDGTLENSLNPQEFYDKLKNGSMAKTAQIPPQVAETYLQAELEKGNDILYIGFSSGLSGSFQSVTIAMNKLREDYPDAKIMGVDSLCASLGQGLLVDYAVRLQKQGKPIEEVHQSVEDMKLHLCHYFTVDDLNHLYRGGRVTKVSLFQLTKCVAENSHWMLWLKKWEQN